MHRYWPRAAVAGVLTALVAFFYRGLLFQGLIIGDYDAFVYFYPLREYAARALSQGRFPLWNPDLFMGSPFFANVQTAVLYPPNLLFLLLPTPYAFSASVMLHAFLAAGGMYLFGRRVLGVSRLPAVLGAVAFTFSGFISWQVSHINQLSVSAWLPLLLVTFDEAVRRRSPALVIGTGAIGAMQFFAGHTQGWYFSTAALGLLALWGIAVPRTHEDAGIKPREVVLEWPAAASSSRSLGRGYRPAAHPIGDPAPWTRLRPLAYIVLVGLIEAAVTAVQWIPTMELSKESIRGGGMAYGEAISFSLPPTTGLFTLLPTYPTHIFSEYVGYVGIIPLVLAFVAFIGWGRRPVTLFMAGLGVLGLLMAIGGYNPLAPRLFRLIPGLDFFRVPARWLLIYTFGAAGLSALGAQLVADAGQRGKAMLDRTSVGRVARLSRVAVSAIGAGGIAGALALLVLLARPAPSVRDVTTWGILAGATAVVVVMGITVRGTARMALGILILCASAELWVAGGNTVFQHPVPFAAFQPQRTSTSYLLDQLGKDGTPERVLSVAPDNYEVKETPDYKKEYNWLDSTALTQFMVDIKLGETLASNTAMEYGIASPDGYDGGILPSKRYANLKALVIPDYRAVPDSQLRLNLPYVPPEHLLDLLNSRYILGGKIKDVSIENVYYDRGISVDLKAGQSRTLNRMPDMQTTAVGIISSTSGAQKQGDGVLAGTLVVTDVSGVQYELPLRLGTETAETAEKDASQGKVADQRPQEVASWPSEAKKTDYFVKIHLPARIRVKQVTMNGSLAGADLRVRAITLIDDTSAVTSPLVLSDAMNRQLFWDMKVYRYNSALPRAYVVYSSMVRDDDSALGSLAQPGTNLGQIAVLAPSETAQSIIRAPAPGFQLADAKISSYQPERVTVDANAREDGYLVLMDSFYPGWVAEVDGKRETIERADYLFRGVFLTKGRHTVVFNYQPSSFYTGAMVSAASIALLVGVVLALGAQSIRRGRVL